MLNTLLTFRQYADLHVIHGGIYIPMQVIMVLNVIIILIDIIQNIQISY